ncbi:unnamed protein product [Closterium sp. NIES-54]
MQPCAAACGRAWCAQACAFVAAEAGRWSLTPLLLLPQALAMRLPLAAAGASNATAVAAAAASNAAAAGSCRR